MVTLQIGGVLEECEVAFSQMLREAFPGEALKIRFLKESTEDEGLDVTAECEKESDKVCVVEKLSTVLRAFEGKSSMVLVYSKEAL